MNQQTGGRRKPPSTTLDSCGIPDAAADDVFIALGFATDYIDECPPPRGYWTDTYRLRHVAHREDRAAREAVPA